MSPDQEHELLHLRALLREKYRLEDEIRARAEAENRLPEGLMDRFEKIEKELREAAA